MRERLWGGSGSRRDANRPPPAARSPQEHYPWFLPTYQSYPYAIQRVDVLRYFLLHSLGGVYIDLDMGCRRFDRDRFHAASVTGITIVQDRRQSRGRVGVGLSHGTDL